MNSPQSYCICIQLFFRTPFFRDYSNELLDLITMSSEYKRVFSPFSSPSFEEDTRYIESRDCMNCVVGREQSSNIEIALIVSY